MARKKKEKTAVKLTAKQRSRRIAGLNLASKEDRKRSANAKGK
jgi:hypothetical protein